MLWIVAQWASESLCESESPRFGSHRCARQDFETQPRTEAPRDLRIEIVNAQ